MKKFLYVSLLCLTAAGCSEESTVPAPAPTPEPAAKSISEIRIEAGNNTELYTFFYDEHQRIQQQIITRSNDGAGLSNEIYEYLYGAGRIDADETFRGQTTRLSFLFDEAGYCVEALDTDQSYYTPQYNVNGYYYEGPAEGAWSEYEYRMVGDRCDLYKIARGYGSGNSTEPSAARYEAVFTYAAAANDTNLDLFYLLAKDLYPKHLQPGSPMLFGWMGKRNSRLPATVEVTRRETPDNPHSVYTYAYETDKEGYLSQITESVEGRTNRTYRITYR